MILRLLPRRGDNWADPTEWGLLPYMDFLLYFLNHRLLRRISYSVILVKHQSPRVSITVHTHHLPLELWHMPWGACRCAVQTSLHGLTAQPLEVLLVGNLKPPAALGAAFVQWPIQVDVWKPGQWVCHNNPKWSSHQNSHGSAKVIWPVLQLDFFLCPIPFLPSWFHKCWS